ncbi:MAG: hypothetical protein NC123_18560 [Butyrivibrio sp.]|nr:hypothetical protein [Butyrivibrio sp.]
MVQDNSVEQEGSVNNGQQARSPNVVEDVPVEAPGLLDGYAGYRIQIDGKVFPNSLIAKGSYKLTPSVQRKISEFYDAYGKKHIRYYPHSGAEIQFKIKKRSGQEQKKVIEIIPKKDIYDIVYWDDSEMAYRTGDFRLAADISYQHDSVKCGEIRYGETDIKFERV